MARDKKQPSSRNDLGSQVKLILEKNSSTMSSDDELIVSPKKSDVSKKIRSLKKENEGSSSSKRLQIENQLMHKGQQHLQINRDRQLQPVDLNVMSEDDDDAISSNSDGSPSSESCTDAVEKDSQLLGKLFDGDKMINIGNKIYCRNKIVNMSWGTSHKASQVARKLLQGVFKEETLLRCTLTGMPPRAQGKERQNEEVIALDIRGRESIIAYSQQVAEEKKWIPQTTREIERAMSQRIGEIKRMHQHAKLLEEIAKEKEKLKQKQKQKQSSRMIL